MSDILVFLLTLAIFIQLAASLLVQYDAKRLGLKEPLLYGLGIIVPTAGFLVLLYYLANHRDLPKAEEESSPEQ